MKTDIQISSVDGNTHYHLPVIIDESIKDNSVRLDLSDNGYWEMQERILQTELNWVRRKLGKDLKRCAKCGEILS